MLINSFNNRIELCKPARLVMMAGPEHSNGEAPSVEQEMKAETIGEQQTALLLESNDVAGKENPVIQKYLASVRANLDKVWAKIYAKSSPPDVKDIAPGVDTSNEDANRFPAAKAYRKVYAELMTLAVNTLTQRQEAQFNAHKEAVCKTHAKSAIERYNAGKKEGKTLSEDDIPRIAAFISASMGVEFDGSDKSMLSPGSRAKKFFDAINMTGIDVYTGSTFEQRTNADYGNEKNATPKSKKATEIAKMDGKYDATINGLMTRAAEDFKQDGKTNTTDLLDYRAYIIDQLNSDSFKEGMSVTDFRGMFLSPDDYLEFRENKEANKSVEGVLEDVISKATKHLRTVPVDTVTSQNYVTMINNLISSSWSRVADKNAVTAKSIVADAAKLGLTVQTNGNESPTVLPSPKLLANTEMVKQSKIASELSARLTDDAKKAEVRAKVDPLWKAATELYSEGRFEEAMAKYTEYGENLTTLVGDLPPLTAVASTETPGTVKPEVDRAYVKNVLSRTINRMGRPSSLESFKAALTTSLVSENRADIFDGLTFSKTVLEKKYKFTFHNRDGKLSLSHEEIKK